MMKNNVNLKYFKLQLKKNIAFSLFNLIAFSLVYIVPVILMGIKKANYEETINYYRASTEYGYAVFLLAMYAVIIPMKSFAFLTKKKTIDTYYSLPIERNKIAVINVLSDIISTIVPFTIVFFAGSIITLLFYPDVQYFNYFIVYLILIFAFILYTFFNSFFFTRANRILDCIITMVFANFVVFLFFNSFELVFKFNNEIRTFANSLLPFNSFSTYGNYFSDVITAPYDYLDYVKARANNPLVNNQILSYNDWYNSTVGKFNIIPLIMLFIFSSITTVLFFVLSKKDKPESAEDIANSKFGLQVLSPIMFTGLTLAIYNASLIYRLLLFIVIAIGYLGTCVIELRSFWIPLYKILMLVGMLLLLIVI